MAAYDDLNSKRIFTVGIISIVVTAVTALAVQVVYYSLVEWHEADLAEKSSYRRQNKILADQASQVSSYGVNPETGNITIPVSKAMELIAANSTTAEVTSLPNESHDDDAGHGDDEKMKAKHSDKEHSDKEHSDKEHGDDEHKEDTDTDAF